MRPLSLLTLLLTLSLPLANTPPPLAEAQPLTLSNIQQKFQAACSFLKSLYNPTLQLVKETPSSHVYYIASDGLLAKRALATCDPTTSISRDINQSINSCCGTGADFMHESILGNKIPLPIHNSTTYTIANSTAGVLFHNITPTAAGGNYTVLWEVHNATGTFPDCAYADVTVYSFLELKRERNETGAQHEFDCLTQMFDNKGMADEPYKDGNPSEHGIYQTLKTALYLYTIHLQTHPTPAGLEATLLRTQGPDGGFHTGYDQAGTYAGTLENTETTSIVIIALSSITTPPAFPAWILITGIAILVAGAATILIVLVLDNRRNRELSSGTRSVKAFDDCGGHYHLVAWKDSYTFR